MAEGEIVLYRSADGTAQFQLIERNGSVWMSQAEIAALYEITPQAVTQHIRTILNDGELTEAAICKSDLQVRQEGNRRISRNIRLYRLEMILAIGYRVRSARGVQFRQWATDTLSEYLHKGFVINDERLKNPGQWDYFDELLERIRDIRASEKRFYQKIRDLFSLSQDYKDDQETSSAFFATVQNKMIYAVTGQTAAELIVARADPEKANMNLQSWAGYRVRKSDVIVAKNYLTADEVSELNRIVVMFLDFAQDRVSQRKHLTLADWKNNVDRFITFNERPLLNHAGRISHSQMTNLVHDRFAIFDHQRKQAEAKEADAEDLANLEALETAAKAALKPPPRGG